MVKVHIAVMQTRLQVAAYAQAGSFQLRTLLLEEVEVLAYGDIGSGNQPPRSQLGGITSCVSANSDGSASAAGQVPTT